jgi:hypothetical protein
MRRSRIALAGILAVGLVGSAAATATASDGTTAPRHPRSTAAKVAPPKGCPDPDQLPAPPRIAIKDGKVLLDGKVVGDAPEDGEPLVVVMKDGKVYVGDEAREIEPGLPERLPAPVPGPGRKEHIGKARPGELPEHGVAVRVQVEAPEGGPTHDCVVAAGVGAPGVPGVPAGPLVVARVGGA